MLNQEVEITNNLGLHARASVKLTQLAGQFSSEVFLARNGRKVNAKSVLGIMMLAASKGTKVAIEVNGSDEREAMQALVHLIEDKLGQGE
ncbi:MAG: HPr family phosphocarrier protein [Pseudomonadota bacterium]